MYCIYKFSMIQVCLVHVLPVCSQYMYILWWNTETSFFEQQLCVYSETVLKQVMWWSNSLDVWLKKAIYNDLLADQWHMRFKVWMQKEPQYTWTTWSSLVAPKAVTTTAFNLAYWWSCSQPYCPIIKRLKAVYLTAFKLYWWWNNQTNSLIINSNWRLSNQHPSTSTDDQAVNLTAWSSIEVEGCQFDSLQPLLMIRQSTYP